jgi:hypothetical protein
MYMLERAFVTETIIDPNRVFLVSGQMVERKVGGREGVGAAVVQRVVHADDAAAAYRALAEQDPAFQPLGVASLFDYEDAARRVRACIDGQSDEWPLVEAAAAG